MSAHASGPTALPVSARADARNGLSTASALTLLALGVVVLLVSLPRLREFALVENEADAAALTGAVAAALAEDPPADVELPFGVLLERPLFARRAQDAELLDGGRLLRRHGYAFRVERPADGPPVVLAWPWEPGRTGRVAYRQSVGGALERVAALSTSATSGTGVLAAPPGAPAPR